MLRETSVWDLDSCGSSGPPWRSSPSGSTKAEEKPEDKTHRTGKPRVRDKTKAHTGARWDRLRLARLYSVTERASPRVVIGTEKVQRDVRDVSDHPTVVRLRRNVEQFSRPQLDHTAVAERGRCGAGDD